MNDTHTAPATAETPPPLFSGTAESFLEMGAYECLWERHGTWSRLEKFLRAAPHEKISELVEEAAARACAERAHRVLGEAGIQRYGARTRTETEYGGKLRAAALIPPCLYFQGRWDLAARPSVAVIGTRAPTTEGARRARRLARLLAADGYVIVSGLARGIDAAAHETALAAGGATVAVMGTPLQRQYPAENRALREELAAEHLVVTQFPTVAATRPHCFPERNRTMSALSDATVIVEAGERSGTHAQAKAALEQGRGLFILDSCFRRGLRWPEQFAARGAVRVRSYEDLRQRL